LTLGRASSHKTYATKTPKFTSYLASLVDNYVPTRTLRSTYQFLLCSPTVKLVCSRKAFSVNAPFVFNSIPYNYRSAPTLPYFKQFFKTYLFSNVYSPNKSSPSRASDSLVTHGASTNVVLYCIVHAVKPMMMMMMMISSQGCSVQHSSDLSPSSAFSTSDNTSSPHCPVSSSYLCFLPRHSHHILKPWPRIDITLFYKYRIDVVSNLKTLYRPVSNTRSSSP